MSPRRTTIEQSKGVFEVEWPLFGELSRALALKVVRSYDPEIIVGIATAGVVPGAVIAAILDREFHSIVVSRRYQAEIVRDTPAIFGAVPPAVRGRRVLIVDETCDSGATMRLAVSAIVNVGAAEVRTAVAFQTGSFEPDFHALATESTIVLPWDREVLFQGELVPNPLYRETCRAGRSRRRRDLTCVVASPAAIASYTCCMTSVLPSRNRHRSAPVDRHSTSITASGASATRPKKSANIPADR